MAKSIYNLVYLSEIVACQFVWMHKDDKERKEQGLKMKWTTGSFARQAKRAYKEIIDRYEQRLLKSQFEIIRDYCRTCAKNVDQFKLEQGNEIKKQIDLFKANGYEFVWYGKEKDKKSPLGSVSYFIHSSALTPESIGVLSSDSESESDVDMTTPARKETDKDVGELDDETMSSASVESSSESDSEEKKVAVVKIPPPGGKSLRKAIAASASVLLEDNTDSEEEDVPASKKAKKSATPSSLVAKAIVSKSKVATSTIAAAAPVLPVSVSVTSLPTTGSAGALAQVSKETQFVRESALTKGVLPLVDVKEIKSLTESAVLPLTDITDVKEAKSSADAAAKNTKSKTKTKAKSPAKNSLPTVQQRFDKLMSKALFEAPSEETKKKYHHGYNPFMFGVDRKQVPKFQLEFSVDFAGPMDEKNLNQQIYRNNLQDWTYPYIFHRIFNSVFLQDTIPKELFNPNYHVNEYRGSLCAYLATLENNKLYQTAEWCGFPQLTNNPSVYRVITTLLGFQKKHQQRHHKLSKAVEDLAEFSEIKESEHSWISERMDQMLAVLAKGSTPIVPGITLSWFLVPQLLPSITHVVLQSLTTHAKSNMPTMSSHHVAYFLRLMLLWTLDSKSVICREFQFMTSTVTNDLPYRCCQYLFGAYDRKLMSPKNASGATSSAEAAASTSGGAAKRSPCRAPFRDREDLGFFQSLLVLCMDYFNSAKFLNEMEMRAVSYTTREMIHLFYTILVLHTVSLDVTYRDPSSGYPSFSPFQVIHRIYDHETNEKNEKKKALCDRLEQWIQQKPIVEGMSQNQMEIASLREKIGTARGMHVTHPSEISNSELFSTLVSFKSKNGETIDKYPFAYLAENVINQILIACLMPDMFNSSTQYTDARAQLNLNESTNGSHTLSFYHTEVMCGLIIFQDAIRECRDHLQKSFVKTGRENHHHGIVDGLVDNMSFDYYFTLEMTESKKPCRVWNRWCPFKNEEYGPLTTNEQQNPRDETFENRNQFGVQYMERILQLVQKYPVPPKKDQSEEDLQLTSRLCKFFPRWLMLRTLVHCAYTDLSKESAASAEVKTPDNTLGLHTSMMTRQFFKTADTKPLMKKGALVPPPASPDSECDTEMDVDSQKTEMELKSILKPSHHIHTHSSPALLHAAAPAVIMTPPPPESNVPVHVTELDQEFEKHEEMVTLKRSQSNSQKSPNSKEMKSTQTSVTALAGSQSQITETWTVPTPAKKSSETSISISPNASDHQKSPKESLNADEKKGQFMLLSPLKTPSQPKTKASEMDVDTVVEASDSQKTEVLSPFSSQKDSKSKNDSEKSMEIDTDATTVDEKTVSQKATQINSKTRTSKRKAFQLEKEKNSEKESVPDPKIDAVEAGVEAERANKRVKGNTSEKSDEKWSATGGGSAGLLLTTARDDSTELEMFLKSNESKIRSREFSDALNHSTWKKSAVGKRTVETLLRYIHDQKVSESVVREILSK